MQNDSFFSSNGERRTDLECLQYQYLDSSSPSSLFLSNTGGDQFYSSYTPPPFTPSPFSQSTVSPPPFSPSPFSQSSIWSNADDALLASDKQIYLRRLALKYQDISERYEICLSRLQDIKEEAEYLRHENLQLRRENCELTNRLSMISKGSLLANRLNRMRIGASDSELPLQPISENHVSPPPKSISVRSKEFLKKKSQSGPARPVDQPGSIKEIVGASRKTRSG
ncbi:hypothetical protein LUZ60_000711 [Juncus effusus]|nr:hypothetical protein LUZ60_000711 [Juncus effusus]